MTYHSERDSCVLLEGTHGGYAPSPQHPHKKGVTQENSKYLSKSEEISDKIKNLE